MTSLQGKRASIAFLMAASAVAVAGAATLGDVLSQQPVIAPEATQEEPAVPAGSSVVQSKTAGCWEVTLAGTGLSARWIPTCANLPPVKPGARPWRAGVVRLPGVDSAPATAHAHLRSAMSAELAQSGEGALLFLPVTAAGAGYYVAAWHVFDDDPAQVVASDVGEPRASRSTRGYQVGHYGTAPVSVQTPAGRVYLQPDFAPRHALGNNAFDELVPADHGEPADPSGESVATPAGEPTT